MRAVASAKGWEINGNIFPAPWRRTFTGFCFTEEDMRERRQFEIEEEKDPKKVSLQLITGGKEPPTGDECWLDKLPIGSCFLVKENRNPQEFILGLFRIGSRSGKATVLNSPQIPGNLYVDAITFCNKYRLYEDLGVMTTPDDDKEITDDERDREQPDARTPNAPVE